MAVIIERSGGTVRIELSQHRPYAQTLRWVSTFCGFVLDQIFYVMLGMSDSKVPENKQVLRVVRAIVLFVVLMVTINVATGHVIWAIHGFSQAFLTYTVVAFLGIPVLTKIDSLFSVRYDKSARRNSTAVLEFSLEAVTFDGWNQFAGEKPTQEKQTVPLLAEGTEDRSVAPLRIEHTRRNRRKQDGESYHTLSIRRYGDAKHTSRCVLKDIYCTEQDLETIEREFNFIIQEALARHGSGAGEVPAQIRTLMDTSVKE